MDRGEARRRVGLLTDRLGRHPDDLEARELLARDLAVLDQWNAAIEQLDRLLELGEAAGDRRAEWMGLKAAWLRELEEKDPRVREWLERIIREYPNTVQAQGARRRIQLMDEQARTMAPPTAQAPPRIVIRMDDDPSV